MSWDTKKSSGRRYVWETVHEDDQDRGANDEGYYYDYCYHCRRRTEQGDGCCFSCNKRVS